MGWALVGVEVSDRDALDAGGAEARDLIGKLAEVERRHDMAISIGTLIDAAPERPRHQRLGQLELQIVVVVARLAPDRENVDEPRRREEPGTRPLALDHRIGGERRAMEDDTDVLGPDSSLAEQAADALDHRVAGIARRRQEPCPRGACRSPCPRGRSP